MDVSRRGHAPPEVSDDSDVEEVSTPEGTERRVRVHRDSVTRARVSSTPLFRMPGLNQFVTEEVSSIRILPTGQFPVYPLRLPTQARMPNIVIREEPENREDMVSMLAQLRRENESLRAELESRSSTSQQSDSAAAEESRDTETPRRQSRSRQVTARSPQRNHDNSSPQRPAPPEMPAGVEAAREILQLLKSVCMEETTARGQSQQNQTTRETSSNIHGGKRLTSSELKLIELSMPKFSGETYEAPREFIKISEEIFKKHEVPEETWVSLAVNALQNKAKSWWRTRHASYQRSWQDFSRKLIAEYDDARLVSELRAKLYGKKQEDESTVELIESKLNLFNRLHPKEKEEIFFDNLIELLKVEIRGRLRPGEYRNREELISAARRVERDHKEMQQSRRSSYSQNSNNGTQQEKKNVPSNSGEADPSREPDKNQSGTQANKGGNWRDKPKENWRQDKPKPGNG